MNFTTEQLEQDIEEIDSALRKEKIPIHGRPIRATCDFSKKYKICLPISEPQPGTYHESYEFWPITEFILKWFDDRYGDRLGTDMGPGKCVFLLRGDPWFFHYPKFFGSHHFVLSREYTSNDLKPINGVPAYNVFESIHNFPAGLRKSITKSELQCMLDTYSLGFSALTILDEINDSKLVNTAVADYEAAVSYIMSAKSDYALSKWSSLQAIEKILKYVIHINGQEYSKTHDLCKLNKSLKSLGVNVDIDAEISTIQCKPGIRYGEEMVSLNEAVAAYHAALLVVYKLKSVLQ